MDREDNLTERQKYMLNKASETSAMMLNMLEDLLDISQIESGKVRLNLGQVDLDKLIEENVELNQVVADRKSMTLNYTSNGPTTIEADAIKVQQIINNLISNAIKYSNNDTTISIGLTNDNDTVIFSVTDQGQGIPEAEIELLFKPFSKTSVKSTGGEKSTGLGLAITQKVVEAHHGKITVVSALNKGSTFTVTLPCQFTKTY